jgi:uncharacterized protein YecE (DUF72 family)
LPEILVGCSGFTGQISVYAKKLPFLELSSTFTQKHKKKFLEKLRAGGGAVVSPAPSTETASAKAKPQRPPLQMGIKAFYHITHPSTAQLYKSFPFDGLPSTRSQLGLFQDSALVKDAYQKTKDAADVVQARSILFETPIEFTPSRENQERFVRFFSEIDRGGRAMIWSAHGPWDLEQQEELAKKVDVAIAYEPQLSGLADERAPEGDTGYLILRGPNGRRRRYASFELQSFLRAATQYKTCFVVFSHEAALADASAFAKLHRETPADAFLFDETDQEE